MLPGRRACIMRPLWRHFSQQITQHIARDIFRIKVSEPKELGRNGQAPPIHADKLGKRGFVRGQPRRRRSCVTTAPFAREHQPREPICGELSSTGMSPAEPAGLQDLAGGTEGVALCSHVLVKARQTMTPCKQHGLPLYRHLKVLCLPSSK